MIASENILLENTSFRLNLELMVMSIIFKLDNSVSEGNNLIYIMISITHRFKHTLGRTSEHIAFIYI